MTTWLEELEEIRRRTEIAKEMGGALSAASEGPDRGAIFTLELPVQAEKKTL